MKKLCFLLCCILSLQLLIGCSRNNEEIQQPVNFYYINKEISYNTEQGVICSEIREGARFSSLEDLLREYLAGPDSLDLQSLMPDSVSLQSCVVENETVHICLSSEFAGLSGVKLTTVCSAILLTVHDYVGAQTIYVSAANEKLDDKDVFQLSMDGIVLMDTVASMETKE